MKKNCTLVFQLTGRGFASEINNMLLAILYCIVHEIRFTLYSKCWNARYKQGWNDYFFPFCKEQSSILFHENNVFRTKNRTLLLAQKIVFNNHIITRDIWKDMRSDAFTSKFFDIPKLRIKGDIFHAKQVILKMLYKHNEEVNKKIFAHKLLHKAQPYVSVHIRRGDKISTKEAEKVSLLQYVEKIKNFYPKVSNVYIATDDFSIIDEFKAVCPDNWNIFTICKPHKTGHDQWKFNNFDRRIVKQEMMDLFAELHFMFNSQFFVGTYSSNIGRLIALMKGQKNCNSVDIKWPPI